MRLGLSDFEVSNLRRAVLKDRMRGAATLLIYLDEECNEGRDPNVVAEEVAHLCIALGIEPELLTSMMEAAQALANDVIKTDQKIWPARAIGSMSLDRVRRMAARARSVLDAAWFTPAQAGERQ